MQFTWFFGDGTSTNDDTNPTHIYEINGSYEITLVASNSAGCTDTTVQQLNMTDLPPDLLIDNLTLDIDDQPTKDDSGN